MEALKNKLDNLESQMQYNLRVELCAECELVCIGRGGMINFQGLAYQREDRMN